MSNIIYISLAVILIVIFIIIKEYNKMINLQNKVKQSSSGIDICLNQRFDLIPNLVECVKGYTKYEEESLESIIDKRNIYNKTNGLNIKQANELNNDLNKLLAVAESYPDLKASSQYTTLQAKLGEIEKELQVTRKIYNQSVTEYNTKIESVPSNLIAGLFGFKVANLFQIDETKKENIKIDL